MKGDFLDEVNKLDELDDLDKKAVSDIYNTVYGDTTEDDNNEDTEDAKLVDLATEEPPTLAEFENLGAHTGDDISVTEQGLKLTQTLPNGTEVTTIK